MEELDGACFNGEIPLVRGGEEGEAKEITIKLHVENNYCQRLESLSVPSLRERELVDVIRAARSSKGKPSSS